MSNRSSIVLDLVDVGHQPLRDRVVVELRNLRVSSLRQRFELELKGQRATLTGVPAFPDGLAELLILPQRYRFKKLIVNVPAGEPLTVREHLFLNPDRAAPVFPKFSALPADLRAIFKHSHISAADWNAMPAAAKAGLLNITAKARVTRLADGSAVLDYFTAFLSVDQILPARIYAVAKPSLHEMVLAMPEAFRRVSGVLHLFPAGWQLFTEDESFKTFDEFGNLQLTFGREAAGNRVMVDADLDDHSGIEHAFDVIRHRLTGTDTNPYDMHQILRFFQNIDPGYEVLA